MESLDRAIQELIDGNQPPDRLPFGRVRMHLLAIKKEWQENQPQCMSTLGTLRCSQIEGHKGDCVASDGTVLYKAGE